MVKEEVEVEPDAVVPDTKEPDEETEGEQEEETTSIQLDEAESTEAPYTEPEHGNPVRALFDPAKHNTVLCWHLLHWVFFHALVSGPSSLVVDVCRGKFVYRC